MGIAALLVLLLQEPVKVAGGEVKPGLVAVYRSLVDPGAVLTRIDAKPAFTLGEGSPHPRIPPGPFEVVWTGLLLIQDVDAITLSSAVGGDLTIEIDGRAVAGPLEVKPGFHRLRMVYRSKGPARLQLS